MDFDNEEIIKDRKITQEQRFKHLHDKSYILQQNASEDSNLIKLFDKQKKLEKLKKISAASKIYEFDHWRYYIVKNLELFSSSFFDLGCIIITYPLNTIKTRIQCRHPIEDVAFFQKNKVSQQSIFKGISYGVLSQQVFLFTSYIYTKEIQYYLLLQNFEKNNSKILALISADLIAASLRLPFDIRKQQLQVNDQSITLKKTMLALKRCLLPSIVRDVFFRLIYGEMYYNLVYHKSWLFNSKKENEKQMRIIDSKVTISQRMNYLLASTIIACILTNPFDVIVTKLATQQYNKYTGFFNCLKQVQRQYNNLREENILKVMFGGLWARFAFYGVTAALVSDFQIPFKNAMEDAFSI